MTPRLAAVGMNMATILALVFASLTAFAGVDRVKASHDFAAQRFGIFIHWGLYSNYAQGEWFLERANEHGGKLDEADYSRMIDGFYPSKFDAKEWVSIFKDAGARYLTVTTRHHDGFSLWPSKVDDGYNIGHSPFRRDIVGELADACREAGLKVNFYYSLMDWHRTDYPCKTSRDAKWVHPQQDGDFAAYKKFMYGQVEELMDRYHPAVMWFDGEWDRYGDDWTYDPLYDMIHAKGALVANNHHRALREKEDIQIFERDLPGDNSSGFEPGGVVSDTKPLEQCDVIQWGVWGYKIVSWKFLTGDEIVAMVARAAAKDSNLVMNIGPDGSGRLPAKAVAAMKGCGEWFRKNGESIYDTRAAGLAQGREVVTTRRGNVLYVHFLDPKVNATVFKISGKIAEAINLADGTKADIETASSGRTIISVTRDGGDPYDKVVRLTVE